MFENSNKPINPYAPVGQDNSYGFRQPSYEEVKWDHDNKPAPTAASGWAGHTPSLYETMTHTNNFKNRYQKWLDLGLIDINQLAAAAQSGNVLSENVYNTMGDKRQSQMLEAERLAEAGDVATAAGIFNEAWNYGVKNQRRSNPLGMKLLKGGLGIAAGALTGGFGAGLLGNAAATSGTALGSLGSAALSAGFTGAGALAARNNTPKQPTTSFPRDPNITALRNNRNSGQLQGSERQIANRAASEAAAARGYSNGGQFTQANPGYTHTGGQNTNGAPQGGYTRNTTNNGKKLFQI